MAFKVSKEDLKKSQKCPVGMHLFTLVAVEEPYYNDNGTKIQKCDFESEKGYTVSKWFNDKFISDISEFVQAVDKVTFDIETFADMEIDLEDYKGKKVAASVSHQKDKNNKVQAQIDSFFNADKVPF